MTYDFNPQTQRAEIVWKSRRQPSPALAVLVGEIIYNLRAALDYLVYELAFEDSGKIIEGTQFPIERTLDGWKYREKGSLKGVNAAHRAMIKKLQPCQGCDWTKTLADISNPDKHRKLTDSHSTGEQIIDTRYGDWWDFAGLPGKVFKAQGSYRGHVRDVYVYAEITFEITFSDQTPISETLQLLLARVGETLDLFEPDFKRPRIIT